METRNLKTHGPKNVDLWPVLTGLKCYMYFFELSDCFC
jgi:hypothetical protein